MKLRNLFMAVIAGAAMLVGCNKEVDLGPAKLALDQTTLAFEAAGGNKSVSVTATRDWAVSDVPEWVALSATSGNAAVDAQPVKITVTQNTEYNRSASIVFTIGFARTSLTINQAGPEGEYVTPTLSIADFIKTDGTTEYIVSGNVTKLSTEYNYAYISDGTGEIEVYQPENWSEYVNQIKVGAKLTAQGVYVKYTNKTGQVFDELVGRILSVEDGGEIDYSTAEAKTVEEFIQLADKNTYYKLTGKVSKFSSNYFSFDLTDASGTIYVYSVLDEYKTDEWKNKIKNGGTITIAGKYDYYSSKSQHEVVNAAILEYSDGEGGSPSTPSEPKGTGTVDDPYNPAGANAFIKTLAADTESENDIYVKGIISSVKYQYAADDYGNGTFYITEDGKAESESFYCFRVLYLNNQKFTAGDAPVKVGDEVVVCGKVVNYQGNTPETASNKAYLYSLVPGEGGDPVEPGEDIEGYAIKLTNENTWTAGSDATYGDGFETVVEGIKIGVYKYKSTTAIVTPDQNAAKVYKSAVISINAPEGVNMTALQFRASDYESGKYCKDLTVLEGGSGTVAANTTTYKIGPWTGSANKVVFQAAEAQARLVSVTIAFDGEFNPGGGDEPGGDDPEQPKLPVNDGLTEATAFTVEDAIYVAKNGTEDKEYYVKAVVGKDISIKNGVASFELVDGTTDGKLTVVKAKSFKGEAFDGTEPIEWLDEVILKGKVTEYSTLPALVDGQLVKWNGLPVFDAQFSTIAELNALCTTTATEYVGTLENAVVAFVPNTSNAIIKDATGSILLFKANHGLKQGQTYSGLVNVTALVYKGNYTELTAIDAAFVGDEAAVEPQTVTLAKLAEDGYDKWQNAYVTIKNMEVTAVDKKNVSVKGSDWLMFSNDGNATCAVGDMITVTGTVTKYNSTLEVKAWTMDAIVKAEPAFSTVAELNAACTATEKELVGKLTDAVVSFVPDNKYAVIKDATGSILLYKTNHGLKQGQTFSGWTTVKAVLHYGASELTAMDAAFTGDEAAVAPEALSLATLAADFAKYQNAYVVVENLEVTAVSGKNISVKDGENTYVVYSNAGNATCKAGDIIKATGTVAMYNNNAQIKAWTMDAIEVTKEAPEEEVPSTAITLSFNSISNKATGYTATWVQTCGDYSWTLANFNNNNGDWTYVRCGRKNNASVATITTNAAFTQAITNVVVTYDSYKPAKVNSTKLYVASDAEFTQNVQTVSGSVTGAGAYTYTITTPTANMYYKLEVDCASDSSNGFVQISKVVYNY